MKKLLSFLVLSVSLVLSFSSRASEVEKYEQAVEKIKKLELQDRIKLVSSFSSNASEVDEYKQAQEIVRTLKHAEKKAKLKTVTDKLLRSFNSFSQRDKVLFYSYIATTNAKKKIILINILRKIREKKDIHSLPHTLTQDEVIAYDNFDNELNRLRCQMADKNILGLPTGYYKLDEYNEFIGKYFYKNSSHGDQAFVNDIQDNIAFNSELLKSLEKELKIPSKL